MKFIDSDNLEYNVNPNVNEMLQYQIKGLESDAKDPSDYLRLVARTFSSFKDKSSDDSVSSYINGFEIKYEVNNIQELNEDQIQTNTNYHIFKINPGACFINNQFIEFTDRTMFYRSFESFKFGLKANEYRDFAIIVTYGFIDQYNDSSARIQIVPYSDLTFPLGDTGDKNVCEFKDSSLSGSNVSVQYNTPGLLLAKFSIYGADGRACTTYEVNGYRTFNRIDYQGLDKLYMLNFKLLFEYFGSQAETVFSAANLTQATFISVDASYIGAETKSGSFVRIYQDPNTNKITYLPALASRQAYDQVVGLYLYDFKSSNHLIYMNGLVTIPTGNDARFDISSEFNYLTDLKVGHHYYLENSCSLYDDNVPTIAVGDLVMVDNSGRITTKYYNGSVMVGTATACNQILLNINHSMEIGVQNLLELFGTSATFKRELQAQYIYQNSNKIIEKNNELITSFDTKISNYNSLIGDVVSSSLFIDNDATSTSFLVATDNINDDMDKVEEIYNYILTLFMYTTRFEDIKDIPLFNNDTTTGTNVTSKFKESDQIKKIRNVFTGSDNGIYCNCNISKLIKIVKEIESYLVTIKSILSGSINNYDYKITDFDSILLNKLYIERYLLSDDYDNDANNFENYMVASITDETYQDNINALSVDTSTHDSTIENTSDVRLSKTDMVLKLSRYLKNCESFHKSLNNWKKLYNDLIELYNDKKITLNSQIDFYNDEITNALNNIIRDTPLALDIFHMDEWQRKVFNYTYVSDRLKRCLYLVDDIQTDFSTIQKDYQTIWNSNDPSITLLDKNLQFKRLENITNKRNRNNTLIESYKIEFNKLRVEFGLEPFIESQFVYDMDAGEMIDERLGQYRFGCDDHTNCVNGICDNMLDECSGVIYDDFAILTNQTEINMGKVIDLNISKGTTINLFKLVDTLVPDVVPIITIKDIDGNDANDLFSLSATKLPDKSISGKYAGYQITLSSLTATVVALDSYFVTIDTTKHKNTLRFNITVS